MILGSTIETHGWFEYEVTRVFQRSATWWLRVDHADNRDRRVAVVLLLMSHRMVMSLCGGDVVTCWAVPLLLCVEWASKGYLKKPPKPRGKNRMTPSLG